MSQPTARSTRRSWEHYKRYCRFVATGSGTLSKRPLFEPEEPCYIERGEGCRVWDIDGNEYIDFRNGLGPISLGYSFPAVKEAVARQLEKGTVFCHPTLLEGEVAEMLVDMIPCAEKVRYLKTGGEAMAAALKAARAATGRDVILQCGYNGWLNSLAAGGNVLPRVRADAPLGVPVEVSKLHRAVAWGDLEQCERLFAELDGAIAAVTVAMSYHDPEKGPDFLRGLRRLTSRHGALLITDEIVAGFRIAHGGLHDYCGVDVDLAVFAKGITNGMPLSAVVGKSDVMELFAKAVVSSTYSGEALSLAAAKAALGVYRDQDVIGYLARTGALLKDGMNALFDRHDFPVEARGMTCCPALMPIEDGSRAPVENPVAALFRAAYPQGLSLYHVCYVNFSHKEDDIGEALDRLERALISVKAAV